MAASRGEFVLAGYLTKSPPDNKPVAQWHRRWFLLMDSQLVYPLADRFVRLEYYQSEADAKKFADPKGVIQLNSCHMIQNREPFKGHKFSFDVCTAERTYHLAADSAEDKKVWLQTLNKLLFSKDWHSNGQEGRGSPPRNHRDGDVLLRAELHSKKLQRPLSHTGASSNESRPLPPIPSSSQNRPLPAPPPSDHVPVPKIKKRMPPAPPPPYHTTHSPPSISLSTLITPQPVDIAGHYEVGPGQSAVTVKPSPVLYKKPRVPQTRSLDLETPNVYQESEYSVLDGSNVQGYDPDNSEYSHLHTNADTRRVPTPTRFRKPDPDRTHKKPGYENVPHLDVEDDYSHLVH